MEASEYGNHGKRPESPSYDTLLNQDSNSQPHSHETEIRTYVQNGHSSREVDSASEFNRLSGELNQKITKEMSELMSTVSSRIQRALRLLVSKYCLKKSQSEIRTRTHAWKEMEYS